MSNGLASVPMVPSADARSTLFDSISAAASAYRSTIESDDVILTVPLCAWIRPTLVNPVTVSVTSPAVDAKVVMFRLVGLLMKALPPTTPDMSPPTNTSKKLPAEPMSVPA